MFSPNELNSEYGRGCRARQAFWDEVGIPRKQRTKFAAWCGFNSATEFHQMHKDVNTFEIEVMYGDYIEYKEGTVKKMSGFDSCFDVSCSSVAQSITVSDFQRANTALVKASVPQSDWTQVYLTTNGWSTNAPAPYNKEEETMYSETSDQRQYLERRLNNEKSAKESTLRVAFNLDRESPATMNEAVEMIKTGKATFDEKALARMNDDWGDDAYPFDSYAFNSLIEWNQPKADKEGYKAAQKLVDKAYTDTRDTIKVMDLENGLKALQAFTSTTFH